MAPWLRSSSTHRPPRGRPASGQLSELGGSHRATTPPGSLSLPVAARLPSAPLVPAGLPSGPPRPCRAAKRAPASPRTLRLVTSATATASCGNAHVRTIALAARVTPRVRLSELAAHKCHAPASRPPWAVPRPGGVGGVAGPRNLLSEAGTPPPGRATAGGPCPSRGQARDSAALSPRDLGVVAVQQPG